VIHTIEIIFGLLIVVAGLALLASKIRVAYPILFVIGGLVLGLVPGLPRIRLDPELVFLLFLPPLLYPAALLTSWRDFRANLRPISMLAVRLVEPGEEELVETAHIVDRIFLTNDASRKLLIELLGTQTFELGV